MWNEWLERTLGPRDDETTEAAVMTGFESMPAAHLCATMVRCWDEPLSACHCSASKSN